VLHNQEPPPSQRPNVDKIRAVVITHSYRLEGDIHCPRLGKDGRRLSNMLNNDRRFIAMTNVMLTDRSTGIPDEKLHPFIQVNTECIELVQPYISESEAEREAQ
jgi:hypothetical protein